MGCDLYGASPLVGHKGLCRAKSGTAYGPKDKKSGAVMTQQGLIMPDPTSGADQPWSAFHGETLRSCSSKSGYYEIADSGPNGATFDHKSADAVRKFPNMSLDRVSFSAFAGTAGTLCIKADQPSIRDGIIKTIRRDTPWYATYTPYRWFAGNYDHCPTGLTGQQCNALASSMESVQPSNHEQNMLMEFGFLLAAFTIGPDAYHHIKKKINKWRGKDGGDGPGSSSGGGGNSVEDIIRAYNQGAADATRHLSQEAASQFVSALTRVNASEKTAAGAYTQINGQWYSISNEALNPPLVLSLNHPRFQTADALRLIVGRSFEFGNLRQTALDALGIDTLAMGLNNTMVVQASGLTADQTSMAAFNVLNGGVTYSGAKQSGALNTVQGPLGATPLPRDVSSRLNAPSTSLFVNRFVTTRAASLSATQSLTFFFSRLAGAKGK